VLESCERILQHYMLQVSARSLMDSRIPHEYLLSLTCTPDM